jgi:hypothetical protein
VGERAFNAKGWLALPYCASALDGDVERPLLGAAVRISTTGGFELAVLRVGADVNVMGLRFWFIAWLFACLRLETPALAQESLSPIHHRFRIFLHPALAQGIERPRLERLLGYYVEDLNTIFAKNTRRRFDFDPATDLVVTDSPPSIGYYPGDVPEENYDVWAIVNPDSSSHDGYMSYALDGAGVAAGLYWDAVHDRTLLSNAPPSDRNLVNYWQQIHNVAHEFGHVFGAAIGEYYSLRNVPDLTGEAPVQDLEYYGYSGRYSPFWLEHVDYWSDPMLMWTPRLAWGDQIGAVRFAEVTAAMIDSGYRRAYPISRYVPDLSLVSVNVQTGTGQPIPETLVKVWKVMAHSPYSAQLIYSGTSGSDGSVRFSWNAGPDNEDNLILLKAWPRSLPALVKWVSFYDAQEARMVFGRTNLIIPLHPWTTNPPSLSVQGFGNSARISWPADPGFILENASSLENRGWRVLTNAPVQQGLTKVLNRPANGPAEYYRIRRTWAN